MIAAYKKESNARSAYTLIEVLIVIAVVAILAVTVVLTLNPAQLFSQARDANRIAAVSALDKSVSLYYSKAMENPATLSMGTSSVIYVSIPDPAATSTAGDQCQGLNLPAAPSSTTYHCAASSTYLKVNGTGWVPINFTAIPGGSSLSVLPVDPVNTTSSNEYLVYETNGMGGYELMSNPESQKNASATAAFVRGSNIALLPSFPTSGGSGGSGGGGAITFTTSTHSVGASLTTLAFDSHTNSMITNGAGSNITQINDTTYVMSTHSVGSEPYGIAFDSNTDTLWGTNDFSGTVTQINDTNYQFTTCTAGAAPQNIVFDPHTNTLWTTIAFSGTSVTQINDTSFATSSYPVGSSPAGITFDPHTDTIWVANSGSNTVTQINDTNYSASSYSALASPSTPVFVMAINDLIPKAKASGGPPSNTPSAITFDSHTNTIWVTNAGANSVTQISDTNYTTSTYPVSGDPQGIAFDPHTNSIWVTSENSSTVMQINDTTYATSTYAVGTTPTAVAFDPNTNAIWVANWYSQSVTVFTPSR